MSVIKKVARAATRLGLPAQATEAARLIRKAVKEATAAAALSGRPEAQTFACFAPAMPLQADEIVRHRRALPDEDAAFTSRTYSGPEGSRRYMLFHPGSDAPPHGLVLMLHGCSQDAADFAAGTRMNALAQRHDLLVAYPEQSRSANPSGCWNWFENRDQQRGSGEPAILAGIVRTLGAEFGLGASQIFVAGLSAGGAMAAILAETYPDLLAAVGIHSGLPYGAAHDMMSAFTAMNSGPSSAAQPRRRTENPDVPTIVFHGDADRTVHPGNADAIVARLMTEEAGLRAETTRGTAGGRPYVKVAGLDAAGVPRVEHWTLNGAGHAWSGGSRDGSFTDTGGPDASAEMLRFFLLNAPDADRPQPIDPAARKTKRGGAKIA